MIRGTTPTHTFTLPCDASMVKEVMVIYGQDDTEVFHKDTEDCKLEGDTVSVTLTQEDTFLFDHKKRVQIQLRVLTDGGDALASDVKITSIKKCLNEEVLE